MPKKAKELGPLVVSRLKEPGRYPVGGVAGLLLQVSPTGARSWILRAVVAGKRRDMGLGGYPDVTLAGAHEAARAARAKIVGGVDPIADGRAVRSALAAASAKDKTFEQCALSYIATHRKAWRNPKHAAQWEATLKTYAFPMIGSLMVRDVELPQVLKVLEPIWDTKTETASRLRGRIEKILDLATTKHYRTGLNPARWRGHLDNALAKPEKIARVVHHRALPAAAMAGFMVDLRAMEGMGARALEFAILAAARSGEVRGALWPEIDLGGAVWVVPAERMKAGREHRVPLAPAAVRLLRALPRLKGCDFVFWSSRGTALSDMTLSAVTRRLGVNAVPHGFRSTFRDWASESTNFPREVAEAALAHVLADKTEAAYRRGDLLLKRSKLMAAWADFIERRASADVHEMRAA